MRSDASVWVAATRPRTLAAAVVPVAVGTASVGLRDGVAAGLALIVALALQVAVNFANDLFDGLSGVDTPDRIGPSRAVASGAVRPVEMRRALVTALAVAALAGATVALRTDPRLLAVGPVAVAAALGYSGGRHPYASRGLGELAVLIFFGPVATVGSAYVQTLGPVGPAALASLPVGLLAVALMMTNNARDVVTDAAAGKRTMAVRLGAVPYRRALVAAQVAPFGLLPPLVASTGSWALLLPLLAAPLAVVAVRRVEDAGGTSGPAAGPRWIAALVATARLQACFGANLAASLLVALGPDA